jgi:hypothetical protein
MAVKPASTWSTNWTGSSGRATTAYNAGVQAYTGDWAAATTAQQAVMQQNWLNSLANGTWAAGVNATGTSGWKTATEAKAANYGTGFQAGANKYASAANKLQPFMSSAVASLPPRGDINANLQRSAALAMALHSAAANGQFRA